MPFLLTFATTPQLYNHFKAQLERRIDHYGRDQMALDTGKLARMNAELERQCVVEMVGGATVEQGGPPLGWWPVIIIHLLHRRHH